MKETCDKQNKVWFMIISFLSYDVAPGSEITPCFKINKPQMVYRFSGHIMMSITTLDI